MAQQTSETDAGPQMGVQGRLACLVVDGDARFADRFKGMILKSCGQKGGVRVVNTIDAAGDLLLEERFDICFLDYDLVAAEGFSDPRFVEWRSMMTAFIFVSANPQRDAALRALNFGGKDFLAKESLSPFVVAKAISYALFWKYRELELEAIALRDNLTGLKNKPLFEEHLRHTLDVARRGKEKVGLLMIGINGVEPVKEDYGDQVAGELLKQVAMRISNGLRDSDVVARVGEYEFGAVLVKVESPSIVNKISGVIASKVSTKPYEVSGYSLKVSADVGQTTYPDEASSPVGLVSLAEKKKMEKKVSHDKKVGWRPIGYFR